MRKMNLLVVVLYLTSSTMFAQSNDNELIIIPSSSGQVTEVEKPSKDEPYYYGFDMDSVNIEGQTWSGNPVLPENQYKAGISVNVNRNFGANNMGFTVPPDNSMAISNGGFIISADNNKVDYYNENGDSTRQFTNPYTNFYTFSGFTLDNVFDPRVIYDRYSDRFILVTIDHRKDTTSCLYVSFSKNNTPSDSLQWNHYKLPIDSTHYDLVKVFWYDYINIAVNKTELYITSNVFEYFSSTDNSTFTGNALWRIEKQNGYDSLALNCKKNSDILKPNSSEKMITLVPLSESLQSDSYDDGCVLVANNSRYVYSDSLYWFRLTGNISNPLSTIESHYLTTTQYQIIPYASQPGGLGTDRIRGGDCRINSGFIQNGKIHSVYVRNHADWGQIVYSVIDTTTNTENRNTWGVLDKNYLYPSIASFSNDTITEDVMIAFLRVGPTEYPQVCAVNYNNGWSPNSTIIQNGVDLLNRENEISYPWDSDSLERLGDYTSIQRRYNQKACWLAGSYAFGSAPDLGGVSYGLRTWIAEIGDTDVGVSEIENSSSFQIYPNPVKNGTTIYFTSEKYSIINQIEILDLTGKLIYKRTNNINSKIDLPIMTKGMYILKITTKNNNYETYKILVD